MKKILIIVIIPIAIFLVGYFSIIVYAHSKLNNAKEKIIENNPEITKVEYINSSGHWLTEKFRKKIYWNNSTQVL
ncbi:hypothetical protein [Solibacillus sp. FSL H8-0538]|uniref:hypothetical protein n=1 Tax=Solibacillus sp. FSL H8-0538 TaxID=2921400 RepID=UPI0030F7D901